MTTHHGTEAQETANQTVVVGCDGSWDSLRAVEAAAHEAASRHTALVILALPSAADLYSDTLDEVIRRERTSLDRGEAVARGAVERARAAEPHLRVEVLVTLQHSTELTALAARAGLLVLGGHGRGGQSTFSFGSTSAFLSHRFRAPVLVSAGNRTSADLLPRTKVVVGLSGASEDLILANAAISEARVRHCPLVAVRAVLGVPGLDEDQRQMIAAEANAWETLSVSTRAAAVQAGIEVRRGDPVEVLTSQCGPQDLLVLGNRGAGHLSGIVPGSLTLRVINAVPCDVLLVPAGAGTASRQARSIESASSLPSSADEREPLIPA
jgi:nucleotide-binding universal stress UspA family protein